MNAEIVSAARGWLGTPYVHQCSTRAVGADCLGLIRGVWREVLGQEPANVPPYTPDWSEPQSVETLWQAADIHMIAQPADALKLGHVILFRMRQGSVAKHLGIVSAVGAEPAFVHAFSRSGVVESALSAPWRRRIVAQFQFPEEIR